MHGKVGGPDSERLLDEIQSEYAAYDHARREAVALYDAGHPAEAKAALLRNHAQAQRLRDLFAEFGRAARADAEATLGRAEQSVRRLADVLVGTSIAGALASLLVGFLWARRITKPITELEVQVESAAERTRIHLAPGRAGLETLGDQVSAIVEKLEETDAALFEHRRRLVQSEKLSAVGELAAKLAHEILNPLAGMKAATQLLERQGAAAPGGGPVIETARALDREITRVEGLVRRLMNYARPLAPRFELCTVGSVVDAALEAALPALTRHGSQIARREEPDLPPLEVDPQLITQALVNLIVNAAEATPAGWRHRGRGDARDQPRARRGRRPGARSRRRHPGRARAGAVQAVLHHQARGARSRPGGQPEHPARARRPHRRRQPPRSPRRRLRATNPGGPMTASVLIADDEALIRQSVRALLTDEGFDVHVAASGAEAWTRFQETRPDVVLLDLVLGDADGLDVLRKMKQETPDTKVILISAHGSIESAVAAMKLGGYDFIKKPFELEEIVAAVRNAVRTSRLEQRVAYLAAQERRRSGGAPSCTRRRRWRASSTRWR